MEELKTDRVVVPILSLDRVGGPPTPLGTGFFIGVGESVLVTCYHVVKDSPKLLAIAVMPEANHVHQAMVTKTFPKVDLAFLEVPTYRPSQILQVAQEDDQHGNRLVVCHEHSQTRRHGSKTILSASARVGNVVRTITRFNLWNLGLSYAGEVTALELSFPTLKGASGAPIMTNDGLWHVLGVVVGNVGKELVPNQIETVYDEETGRVIEEVKYMLPQGIAIHAKHLREVLQEL